MHPDEERGVLYCTAGRILMVDLKTGEVIGKFKGVSHCIQVLWDERGERVIVKSTVGDFAVFKNGAFDEPIWRFKLKKIDNTDGDFIIENDILYGVATSRTGAKYFIIDINNQTVTECKKNEVPARALERGERQQIFISSKIDFNCIIPEKYHSIEYVSSYYENDKFEFVGSWNQLRVIPKEQALIATDSCYANSSENYISKNGLSKFVFDTYSEEDIIHGGYFWALDKGKLGHKETKEIKVLLSIGWLETEIGCGGLGQYLQNGNKEDFDKLIKSLGRIGANKTLKVIKDAAILVEDYNNEVYDDDNFSYEVEVLEERLNNEDYIKLAVEYLKKNCQ